MEKARMNNFVYIDNSNVWIEGKKVSAGREGLAVDIDEANERKMSDYSWRIDFGKLFNFVGGDSCTVKVANLYGSRPPQNDSLWESARNNNFEPKVVDRNSLGKEKKIDTQIVTDIMRDAYVSMTPPEQCMVSLVAGDADYVPVIKELRSKGIFVEVAFWNHASHELRRECDNFVNLNDHIDEISFS